MLSKRWLKKYEAARSPQEWFDLFAAGEETLEGISRVVGVSRETIRNDFVKLVGESAYLNAVNEKRKNAAATVESRGIFYSCDDYLKRASGTPLLAKVICKLATSCAKLDCLNVRSLRSPTFSACGKNVLIRYGELKPTMRDFPSGYLRFKVSDTFCRFDAVAFFVVRAEFVVSYIIPPEDIIGVQSLALRAKEPLDEGKYMKYLENWNFLQR